MGVYIKDMEIPDEEQSVITINIYSDGVVTCYDDDVERKAVPVPPHGRLIDAGAVSLEGGPYEYDEWCKWALDQYLDAPTIIEADCLPVHHGTFAATSGQEAIRRLTGEDET